MNNQTQKKNKRLPIFINSLTNKKKKEYIDVNKKLMGAKEKECFICFDKIENNMSKVSCSSCYNYAHYNCYKEFIKKNDYYVNKCLYCNTESIQYDKKYWWNCCF